MARRAAPFCEKIALTSAPTRKGRAEGAMLRQKFTDSLKEVMKGKDQLATSTVRLVIAKLKEQDIDARGKGKSAGIADAEIQQMLQGMITQRRESITLYEQRRPPHQARTDFVGAASTEPF